MYCGLYEKNDDATDVIEHKLNYYSGKLMVREKFRLKVNKLNLRIRTFSKSGRV